MPEAALRHGDRRRRSILRAALDVCSAEGLEGVSIGRLAREVGLSKSGLAAHYDSKRALQLATVDAAVEAFEALVIEPTRAAEAGLERLVAMMSAWLRYVDEIEYRGGCFFAAAGHETASRPGPLHDRIADYTRGWIVALEREARTARRLGEIAATLEPAQLAFELHAFVQEANLRRQLFGEPDAFQRARAAVAASFERVKTAPPSNGDRK